ncbi:DEAD/DEAH box helicase family protein [uncultured Cohaesibacter sp.]|uniref:DEAD/DEAH box helicase family protein n=1 Tax=uncultured Cohaesibacter sp. TaxID=1002546 RepID=UPI0029C60B6B|nr:DEAD/DEAH box helicase family protein [uncultured Cohaesibacter sp.]
MMVTPIQTTTSNAIVDPDFFISQMEAHWTNNLNNTSSQPLRDLWRQMCLTFNEQIRSFGKPEGQRIKVLPPQTGTGKSQGLAVYCSCLSDEDHLGVLIVVRLKQQANDTADTINRLAGKTIALARHTGTSVTQEELEQSPVVIITHKAYENGLDAVARGEPEQSAWSQYHTFRFGQRQLVVIDEALDLLQESKVSLDQVRHLHASLSTKTSPEEATALETLGRFIRFYEALTVDQPEGREMVVKQEELKDLDPASLSILRQSLKSKRLDKAMLARDDKKQNRELIRMYSEILKSVQAIMASWRIYGTKGDQYWLSTAKLILPDEGCGAVILDATANENVLYSLLPDRVDPPVKLPSNARSYANVTLHVSNGHRLGKTYLEGNAKNEVAALMGDLQRNGLMDRKVLICCHKTVEPVIELYENHFKALGVAHWNAIDGRNDWSDYDCVVIFGLPYRDDFYSANLFFAAQGPQSTDWLRQQDQRKWQDFKDVRQSIKVSNLSTSVIQGINRVRCRRVVDSLGNCAPTDVYLLLPSDETGRMLLKDIKDHMPHIVSTSWKLKAARRKPKTSNHLEAFLTCLANMPAGRKSFSDIKQQLGHNRSKSDFIRKKLTNPSEDLLDRLKIHQVSYKATGDKRGSQVWFEKLPA